MDHFAYSEADFARNEADRAREDVKALSEKLDYLAAKLGIAFPKPPKPNFPGLDIDSFAEVLKAHYAEHWEQFMPVGPGLVDDDR